MARLQGSNRSRHGLFKSVYSGGIISQVHNEILAALAVLVVNNFIGLHNENSECSEG